MKKLLIDYNPFLTRVALVEDNRLIDFSVERASVRGLVGNIYKGKVENVLSGMKACFVNIGEERNGFLYVGESPSSSTKVQTENNAQNLNFSAGDNIMCQVVKDQFGLKGARLSLDISLPGYFLVLLPNSNFFGISRKIEDDAKRDDLERMMKSICPPNTGFIMRSAADKASFEDIKSEVENLFELWDKIQVDYKKTNEKNLVFEEAQILERAIRDNFNEEVDIVIVNDEKVASKLEGTVGNSNIEIYSGYKNIMTHYGVSTQINSISERKVNIGNGAYIVIDKTEALTVIDVNTGKFVGTKNLEDTVYNTNLLACECIARQIRLRNLSGIIVVDFIDMSELAHRESVLDKMRLELKSDRMKTIVASMTVLGLCEITRKKTRLPIDDFILSECKDCAGGFVKSAEHLSFVLRDMLIDYSLKNKAKNYIVKLNREVFESIFEIDIMSREIKTIWKNMRIYLVPDESVKRDCFNISHNDDKILSLPSSARLLAYR